MSKRRIFNRLLWIRSHKIIAMLFLAILLVLTFFIYERIALEMNRRAFISARHTIDLVYAGIVDDVGQPNNSMVINECSHSHLELSDGPLSCSVNTEFVYAVRDKAESDDLMSKIKASVAKHIDIFKPISPPKSEIPISPSVHDVSDREVDYYSVSGIPCAISYDYINNKGLDASIGCTSWSRSMLYPLSN